MPPGGPVWIGRPNWWSGRGLAALPEVREAHPEVQEACPEVWEALPKVREGSRDPPKGSGRVEIHSRRSRGFGRSWRRSGRGKEALMEVR